MDLSYFPAITFYELRESNCVQIKCLKLCIQWVLKGFCQVIFYRHCQTSELTFCVWNSPDIQQQLSTSTSCAGGEPGPDRSLARGRKTPSRLLCLRHDEGSRPCCSGCSEDNVAVTLVCCKKAFMPHQFGILRKRQQGHGQRKSNKIRCLKMSKCKSWDKSVFLFSQKQKRNSLIHLTCWECISVMIPFPLAQLTTKTSQSQRSGWILTGNILTSTGRTKYMGTLAEGWRGSDLKDSQYGVQASSGDE